ncbi:hypothetical protein B1B04_07160 [Lysinibacillus sp. KCTC 33748]|uniref:hypothetical protein n=1 Tax=unclassified Lysinibacillus TaxID=2636778 RepID=UPI0009A5EB75|nr:MULTISPECIES: hypothetical protein [unclassified Lysinibacillus]OXS75488.1 hypothetical protein B1B04_07160 [Lysinibacillus sp. KCTC 33748]SKB54097.1 hypothetical protein SAMN06295926_103297 [Lysinibacillus sp. AC-3]
MKTILHENLNGMRKITAQYNPEFKSESFEENAVLHDGRQFNVSGLTLRKEDVQAMLQYFEELEK